MVRWLTSFALLIAFAGTVPAGAPISSDKGRSGMSAMECCKQKSMAPASVIAAKLCCAMNCAAPAPVPPVNVSNLAPPAVIDSYSILKQIASLLRARKPIQPALPAFDRVGLTPKFQPKYIQNHTFLI